MHKQSATSVRQRQLTGTYYAAFYDATNDCYSDNSTEVTVTITTCESCDANDPEADCDGDGVANGVDCDPADATVAYAPGDACDAGAGEGSGTYNASCVCEEPTNETTEVCNTCPATTVDLTNALTPNNQPANTTVTWHTGQPADGTNLVTDATMVGAGTYYAAFFDATNDCYSDNSTEILVTIKPCGPCSVPELTGEDICADLETYGTLDCDGDGQTNATECDAGTDPLDECSNSYAEGAEVCAAIDGGATALGDADCDGGGETNADECTAGTDPLDPCDDTGLTAEDICADLETFGAIDCDGDGQDATTECAAGTDPLDPCSNGYETGTAICAAIDGGASALGDADCDEGGVSNADECTAGTDPLDPCDDAGLTAEAICADLDTYGALDCDGDGQDATTECGAGTDPLDPCSNAYEGGTAICAAIDAGATALGEADCDEGGVDNATECADGKDPTDPSDDGFTCETIPAEEFNICVYLEANPNDPLATLDCDGGGVDNATECTAGDDPTDPNDDYNCENIPAEGFDIDRMRSW